MGYILTVRTLDDIRNMAVKDIEKGISELKISIPEAYRRGMLTSYDILECHDEGIYDKLVSGPNPSAEEGLRVDYASILKIIGFLDYEPEFDYS